MIVDDVMVGARCYAKAFGRFEAQQIEPRWVGVSLDEFEGCTMAMMGLGAIAQEVGVRATTFGMWLIGREHTPTPLPGTSTSWGLPSVLVRINVAGTAPAYVRNAVTVFAENDRTLQREGRYGAPVDLDAGY